MSPQSLRDELAEAQAASQHLLTQTNPELRETYAAHVREHMGVARRALEQMLADGASGSEMDTLWQLYLSVHEAYLACLRGASPAPSSSESTAGLPASRDPREADRKQGPPPCAAVSPMYASHALYAPDPCIGEWTALRDEVAQITGCDPEQPTDWVPDGPAGALAAAFLSCAEEDLVGLSDQDFRAGVDAVKQALSEWADQSIEALSLEEADPHDQAGAAPAKPDSAPPR